MSTRCRVGILRNDGSVKSIYIHNDGYPDGVGEVLVNCYTSLEKINKLLDLGDMSSIGTEPIDNPHAWERPTNFDWNSWRELHPENMCDTYASRGETCPAKEHKDVEEYQKYSRDCWGEFTYLFKDGEWYVLEYDEDKPKLVSDLLQ